MKNRCPLHRDGDNRPAISRVGDTLYCAPCAARVVRHRLQQRLIQLFGRLKPSAPQRDPGLQVSR